MSVEASGSYLAWAKAHVGRLPLCLRSSGMAPRPLAPLMASALKGDGPAGRGAAWHHESIAQQIAARWGCPPDHVQPTMGTSGANFLVLATLLGQDGELLCETPCYDPLWRIAQLLGRPVHFFERRAEHEWGVDPFALEAQLSHQTRVVALSRPHNPSGADIPESVLLQLGELAEAHDLHVLVDEVYLDFLEDARPAAQLHPRLVSTASLTKVYGLGSLRLGWVMAEAALILRLERSRDCVEVLLPEPAVQLALCAWPQLPRWRAQARAIAAAGRAIADAELAGLEGLRSAPSSACPLDFLFWGGDEQALCQELEAQGVGVTPGSFFRAPGGVRVSWMGEPERLRDAARQLATALRRAGES